LKIKLAAPPTDGRKRAPELIKVCGVTRRRVAAAADAYFSPASFTGWGL